MGNKTLQGNCRLCRQDRELLNSHVWPAFGYRHLVSDQSTGGTFIFLGPAPTTGRRFAVPGELQALVHRRFDILRFRTVIFSVTRVSKTESQSPARTIESSRRSPQNRLGSSRLPVDGSTRMAENATAPWHPETICTTEGRPEPPKALARQIKERGQQ